MDEVAVFGDCFQDFLFEIGNGDAGLEFDKDEGCDEICFRFGEKVDAKSLTKTFGGNAYNTSIGFSRLGLKPEIFSVVGSDVAGKEIKSNLGGEDVKTTGLIQEGITNTSAILVFKKERNIISYHEERDYSKITFPDSKWIYFTSAVKGCEKLLPKVMAKKKVFVFNPGSWQLKNFKIFEPYLVHTDILILNKQEAKLISKKEEIKDILSRFSKLGIKLSVVTDGQNGVYISDGENSYHAHIYPTNAVDSTGAGDAFASALIAGLIRKKTILQAIKWGMINSSSVVEKYGATEGLLKLSQIEKRENEWKGFHIKSIRS